MANSIQLIPLLKHKGPLGACSLPIGQCKLRIQSSVAVTQVVNQKKSASETVCHAHEKCIWMVPLSSQRRPEEAQFENVEPWRTLPSYRNLLTHEPSEAPSAAKKHHANDLSQAVNHDVTVPYYQPRRHASVCMSVLPNRWPSHCLWPNNIPLQQVWRPIGEPMDFNIPTYHVMHVCSDLRTPNRLNRFRSVEAN